MKNLINLSEVKKILADIENVTISRHYEIEEMLIKNIPIEEIKETLKNTDKLMFAEDQGDEQKGHKYALLFNKSNKYDIRVVVSIKNKNLNVVTAHKQGTKRRKAYEKWLNK